jgi:hypothetical protein
LAQVLYSTEKSKDTFINALRPGFLGMNIAKNQEVPVKGDLGYFYGIPEKTTGDFYVPSQPFSKLPTDKVALDVQKLYCSTGISDELSVYSAVDVYNQILPQL